MFRKVLSLDIETRSDVDLPKRGVYNYVNTPVFRLLWLTYAYDYGERITIDTWHNPLPQSLIDDLLDHTVLKVAANATFERVCLSRVLGVYMTAESWTCTLVLAGRNGLPMSLAGAAMRSGVDVQKDKAGDSLIKMFSIPQKPTKKNNGVPWINPQDAPEQWQAYGSYNNQDVASETAVRLAIKDFPVSDFEDQLYVLDQKINDRGIMIDRQFVQQAIRLNILFADRLKEQIVELTGVRNPNSRNQLLAWLNVETEESYTKFDKEAVKGMLADAPTEVVQQVLEARQALNRASVAKYAAMERYAGADDRARGTLQFGGATRTFRWAGRGIQMQNLPRHKCKPSDLQLFRDLIRAGDIDGLAAANNGNINDALSQAVRTSFIAKPGHTFIVSDYSAIEARVLAWIAVEQWRLDFFEGSGDIYIESVARMMGLDPATIDRKNPLRQNGKVTELACIAENELVLTDKGLIPIERVKIGCRVWDGRNFVEHDGVIFKGRKPVYKYQGLTATFDHLVFVKGSKKEMPFVEAIQQSRTLKAGVGRTDEHTDFSFSYEGLSGVYDILNCGPNNRFTVSGVLVHNCGYQGGKGALIAMGALKMGIAENTLPDLITLWRNANPAIVKFWALVEDAAKRALVTPDQYIPVDATRRVHFIYRKANLHMVLPSGRWLTYVRAKLEMNRFGRPGIVYEGTGDQGAWTKLDTYAGKLVENMVQGIARDILAHGLMNLDAADFAIVGHVHDEAIIEEPIRGRSLEEVNHLMCVKAPWYADMPLKAEGFVSPYYKKDDA